MSCDEQDAAYDRFIDELYKDFRTSSRDEFYIELFDDIVKDFKDSRLQEFYLANPKVADPAVEALSEAKVLLSDHPNAALVFAVVAAEVCFREAFLNPIIHGLFHTKSAAELIVEIIIKIKNEKLVTALIRTFHDQTGIDLHAYKRPGSAKPIWEEKKAAQDYRNAIIHRAQLGATQQQAEEAIKIAEVLLQEIFPVAIQSIGLHLHGGRLICGSGKCKDS
ncbi:MAG: hypothetical protein HY038_10720 [Nitrospirae bacterium]|nr:hypothetical protein [Nitrospirota bacterium]